MEQILYLKNRTEDPSDNRYELKAQELKGIADELGIGFRLIQPYQSAQLTGYLAGRKGYEEKKLSILQLPPVLSEEVLLLDGLSDEKLDRLLRLMRERGVPVSLKAVITKHNAEWTFAALYEELRKERKELS